MSAGGWMDGYGSREPEPVEDDEDEAPAPAAPRVLACRHCGSDRLSLRSTSNDSLAVKFQCGMCGKSTSHHLPTGYRRIYVAAE